MKSVDSVARTAMVCAVALLVIGGCFGSEDSGSESSKGAEKGSKKTAKQAVGEEGAQDPGSENESPEPKPDRPPGWEISVTGPIQVEASGESILRKYASNAGDSEQVVLAGTPFSDKKGKGRITFTLMGLPKTGAGTYNASRSVASFDDPSVTCRLSSGPDSGKTELKVEVLRDSSVFEGTFEGTLKCPPPEEGEEPRFVDVTGSFLDH